MAILFDAPVTPDAATAFVREVPIPSNLVLSQLVPSTTVSNNEYRWSEITRHNRMARFRAYDAKFHVAKRDMGADAVVHLPALSDSSPTIGEYERLQQEFARIGGTNTGALEQAIYNDAEILTRGVRNRMEMALGDVLRDGKLTINEDGLIQEADFGVPASNIVSASTLWTDTSNAKILTDFIAWFDAYQALNGEAPGTIISSLRVKRLVQQNKELIDATYGATQGRTRINDAQVTDLLGSETGASSRWLVDDTVLLDDNDQNVRVLPNDTVYFLPGNVGDALEVVYGITATALELVNAPTAEMSFSDAPGLVGFVHKDENPPFRQKTYVDAVGMPVLKDANKLFVAKVA